MLTLWLRNTQCDKGSYCVTQAHTVLTYFVFLRAHYVTQNVSSHSVRHSFTTSDSDSVRLRHMHYDIHSLISHSLTQESLTQHHSVWLRHIHCDKHSHFLLTLFTYTVLLAHTV